MCCNNCIAYTGTKTLYFERFAPDLMYRENCYTRSQISFRL